MASERRLHIVILLVLAMLGVFAVAQPIGGSLEAEDVAVILSARGYHGAVAKKKEQVNRCTATILKYKYSGFCSRYLVTLAASRIPTSTVTARTFKHPVAKRVSVGSRLNPPVRLKRFKEDILEAACDGMMERSSKARGRTDVLALGARAQSMTDVLEL